MNHGHTRTSRSPGPSLRRRAPRRHRYLRRRRRPAAGRRLHRDAGAENRLEFAARRTRHHRHGHGHRLRRRPAGLRNPVLRLRLQHHRPAQGGRQSALGRRRAIRHADRGDDAVRLRHSRQPLSLAFLRKLGEPAGRAGRSSCRQHAARRLRPDAVRHRRSQPGDGAAAQGPAACARRDASPGRARRRKRSSKR